MPLTCSAWPPRFSAPVLVRRQEFGLLAHLGLMQRKIITVVAGEGAAWTLIRAVAGLGLAVKEDW